MLKLVWYNSTWKRKAEQRGSASLNRGLIGRIGCAVQIKLKRRLFGLFFFPNNNLVSC